MLTIKSTELELIKRKVQVDLTRNCIAKSQGIIIANAGKQALRNAEFFINRFPFVLPNEKALKELINELDIRIIELKRSISIILRQIVGTREILIEDLFWFSISDLKSGYVLLYPNTFTKFANYVLFLVEARDTFDGNIYYPGDILPFKQVNHILASMKGLSEKELGIGFSYASKYDLINELSILTSKLKSNKL